MSLDRTLRGLIASGRDDAVAIAAHDAPPLGYAALRALIDRSVRSLNDLGIGRGDRVAIVLPNGPEMATAFLCVASAAASAPLNPAYKQDEFEFYLEDLKAKALIVEAGSASPALRAAEKLGVKLITLTPEPQAGAGAFRLSGSSMGAAARPGLAEAQDVALILHTSGTTSRPKIVPLAHANIWTSARQHRHFARAFGQRPRAQCHAPVPHSRADRRSFRAALARRRGVLHGRLQRAQVFRRDGGGETDLVHGGADHAPDDPDARRTAQGDHRPTSAALHPLLFRVAAADGHRRTRGRLQMSGHRGLRDDGGGAPDGVQSPQRRAQAGLGRRRRRS